MDLYVKRYIEKDCKAILNSKKSLLLLGPRQTGKTTFVKKQLKADLSFSLIHPEDRRRFELDPNLIIKEIKGFIRLKKPQHVPIVFIDEVQKIPSLMDTLQWVIDERIAIFILTGSSTRKLRRSIQGVNFLPGRVIPCFLTALSLLEMSKEHLPELEDLLLNGALPEVILQKHQEDKERLLASYVNLYLEEEIRQEALTRQLASFTRFLSLAALEAGKTVNISRLSMDVGVSRNTLQDYFQILEDCLVVDRLDPLIDSSSRRRLTKAPKYLFFDMGIRRFAAKEGKRLPETYKGYLFEQFIGIEILKLIKQLTTNARLKYWRDHAGPEVDYVIEYQQKYLAIEVKWGSRISKKEAKHLMTFVQEYRVDTMAYIVCQTPRPLEVTPNVLAIHWIDLAEVIKDFLSQ